MQTVRQIDRYWTARQYDRLARQLLVARPESSDRLSIELARPLPAAALALIRLDELTQAHHPINQKLIHTLLAAQESDGGWGDPLTTALCLRALQLNAGQGPSIDRAMRYLADLQQSPGLWPSVSIRRTTPDPFVSAFILFHLSDSPNFRAVVRLHDATNWFVQNEPNLDTPTRKLWERVARRLRIHAAVTVGAN